MKKQIKVIFISILVIALLLVISFVVLRIVKGYKIYGNEYCNTNYYLECGGDAITEWTCKLCGESAINSDINVPEICNKCSILTKRCNQCGKLRNK